MIPKKSTFNIKLKKCIARTTYRMYTANCKIDCLNFRRKSRRWRHVFLSFERTHKILSIFNFFFFFSTNLTIHFFLRIPVKYRRNNVNQLFSNYCIYSHMTVALYVQGLENHVNSIRKRLF